MSAAAPRPPLTIGSLALDSRVLLAPMSGVTDMPFRRLVKEHGAGLVVSEMIASQSMIRETRQSLRMGQHTPEEFPMAVQLAGVDPHIMAEAARLTTDLGACIIDINLGCPAKKVVNTYAGSALMRDECLAARILEATVRAVSIPVTLKMRKGWDDNTLNAPRLAKIAEEAGIQMITVHGRTRCQLYSGRADWGFIGNVKKAVSIPVIGNGDVVCEEDALTLLNASGADGVMIGRGAYGRPWFLGQVHHFLNTGHKTPPPPLGTQKEIVLSHFEAILSHYGTVSGLHIARKHLGWYSKGLWGATDFRVAVNQTEIPAEVHTLVNTLYASQEQTTP